MLNAKLILINTKIIVLNTNTIVLNTKQLIILMNKCSPVDRQQILLRGGPAIRERSINCRHVYTI